MLLDLSWNCFAGFLYIAEYMVLALTYVKYCAGTASKVS